MISSGKLYVYIWLIIRCLRKSCENRENQAKGHLGSEKRSHKGGKMSVYSTLFPLFCRRRRFLESHADGQTCPAVVLAVGGMEIATVEAYKPHRGVLLDRDRQLVGQCEACPPCVHGVVVLLVDGPDLTSVWSGRIGEVEPVAKDLAQAEGSVHPEAVGKEAMTGRKAPECIVMGKG